MTRSYLIVLFYSAAVPFLVFSYLLRGIDLPTILLAVALTFTLNVLLTMGAIVIALAPLHTVMKILAALFVGGNAIFTSIWIVGGAVASSVITRGLSSANFWEGIYSLRGYLSGGLSHISGIVVPSSCCLYHALISQPFPTLAPLCHVYECRNDYPVLIVVMV